MSTKKSASRIKLGVRWPRLKDRRCRRDGHVPSSCNSAQMLSGAFWPICERCGYAVKPPEFP